MAETAILPYAMMALGTVAQAKAAGDANDERSRILRIAGDESQKLTGKAIDMSQEGAQKYAATTRLQSEDQAGTTAENSLVKALTESQAQQDPNTGKVSGDYLTDKAKTTTDSLNRSAQLAKLMSRVRAPLDLRFNEGTSNADTASRIAAITGDARSTVNAGGVDASSVMPNQNLMMLGGFGQAAGAGMSAKKKPATTMFNTEPSPMSITRTS